MKNTNQVRQNGSAKAAAPQGKTQSSKAGEANYTVIVCESPDESALNDTGEGLTLTTAEWEAIKGDAAARGETASNWLQRVIASNMPKPNAARANGATEKSVVVVLRNPDGTEWERFDFPMQRWPALKRRAKESGVSVEGFFARAFREKLERLVAEHAPDLLASLAQTLGLNPTETRALEFLSEWESESPAEFCREMVIAGIESSYDELRAAAVYVKGKSKARAWAQRFYSQARPLFDGFEIVPEREVLAKGGAR